MPVFYPKILIIGDSFDNKSGGGITLTNLFKGWKKENIAVASINFKEIDTTVCEKYYRLGSLESKIKFPVNKIGKKSFIESGPISITENKVSEPIINDKKKPGIKYYIQLVYWYITDIIGLEHYSNRLVISDDFRSWVKEFNPDFVYCQLSTLETIRFINDIHFQLNIPFAIHFMDDWPITITNKQKGIFKLYWQKVIDSELRHLLSSASILMSISEAMSEAYYNRYGLKFIPFHNPIALEEWLPYSKNDWSLNETFRILYTGRLGTANNKSILTISKIVSNLYHSNIKIKLDIYSPAASTERAGHYLDYDGVEVKPPLPYKSMPELLSSYDLLLLPLDFDEEGINFAKYSMPTKTSEYMISGTPILVFASMFTALAKYASKEGWAYLVTNNDDTTLLNALNELRTNEHLRMNLAKKAIEVAIRNEDATIVRENFRNCFKLIHNNSYNN